MRIIIFLFSVFLSFSLSAKEVKTFQDLFEYLGPRNPLIIDVDKKSIAASKSKIDPSVTVIDNGNYYSLVTNTNVQYNPYSFFYEFSLINEIGKINFDYIQGEVVKIEIMNSFDKGRKAEENVKQEFKDLISNQLLQIGFVSVEKDNFLNQIFKSDVKRIYVKDDIVVAISDMYRSDDIVTTIVKKDYAAQINRIVKNIEKQNTELNKEKIANFYR